MNHNLHRYSRQDVLVGRSCWMSKIKEAQSIAFPFEFFFIVSISQMTLRHPLMSYSRVIEFSPHPIKVITVDLSCQQDQNAQNANLLYHHQGRQFVWPRLVKAVGAGILQREKAGVAFWKSCFVLYLQSRNRQIDSLSFGNSLFCMGLAIRTVWTQPLTSRSSFFHGPSEHPSDSWIVHNCSVGGALQLLALPHYVRLQYARLPITASQGRHLPCRVPTGVQFDSGSSMKVRSNFPSFGGLF